MRTHESNCKGEKLRGTPDRLVKIYEGKAYAELQLGNEIKSQVYFQQAEHWKKIMLGA